MSNIFLIDSENVGDSWTLLLDAVDSDDELLVFYTQKSPHMSYKNLIRLKNSSKDVTFIECFEGNNALDFQLVTELGYRMALNLGKDNEYFIVSNDNGFEAVVRYWRKNGMPVRRFTGKACASISALITTETDESSAPVPVTETKETTEPQSKDTEPSTAGESETAETAAEVIPAQADEVILAQAETAAARTQSVETTQTETVSDKKDIPSQPSEEKSPEADLKDTSSAVPEQAASDNTPAETIQNGQESCESQDAPAETAETEHAEQIAEISPEEKASEAAADEPKHSPIQAILDAQEKEEVVIDDTAKEILYCIGKENLANLHEALMQLYGNEKCKILYNTFKSEPAYNKIPARYKKMSHDERQRIYCRTAFSFENKDAVLPEDFSETVMKSWKSKKNLNSLRATLINKYGKEAGLKYYPFIKAHIKILDNIN